MHGFICDSWTSPNKMLRGTWPLYIAIPQTHISGFPSMASLFNMSGSCPKTSCEILGNQKTDEKKKEKLCQRPTDLGVKTKSKFEFEPETTTYGHHLPFDCLQSCIYLRTSPGTYPRPSTTCLWRKSFHICILGCLGYVPATFSDLISSGVISFDLCYLRVVDLQSQTFGGCRDTSLKYPCRV